MVGSLSQCGIPYFGKNRKPLQELLAQNSWRVMLDMKALARHPVSTARESNYFPIDNAFLSVILHLHG